MKSKKKLLVLTSIALLGGMVSGCSNVGGNNNSNTDGTISASESASTEDIIQVDGDVYTISSTDKTLSYAAVNEVVDLDEYYEVIMDDEASTVTHKFSVICADPNLVIDGHKIKGTAIGEYRIRLAVNDKNKYITFSVKSEYNIELIDFLKTFEDSDGKNYRIDLGTYNKNTKRFGYENYTIIHNENYAAAFDATDPGAVDEETGESNSFILANLSDGNGYMGYFNKDGVPEFEYGKMSIDNYYIMGSMILDGTAFTSVFDEITGEETLVGDAIQAKTFLNYGMSNLVENYGYSENSFYVLDLVDGDKDGVKDTLYAKITIDGTSTSGVAFTDEEWCTVKISKVGSCTWDSLEKARADASYIPQKINVSEITTAFSNLTTNNNYTTTMNLYACDSTGKVIAPDDVVDYSSMYLLTGNKDTITEVHTVTKSAEIDAKAYVGGELKAKKAYWVEDDGKAYIGTYQKKNADGKEETTKTADTDDYDAMLGMMTYTAANVDTKTISDAIWKKKSVEGDVITYSGNIGDNTKDDGQTNGFFAGLFDQMFCLSYKDSEGGTNYVGFGTYMTMDGTVQYQSGDTCSYTVSSGYEEATVNTATNEITIKALIYLPFKDIDQPYMMCEYIISDVGTTTNDFSSYNVASTETSGDSSSETSEAQ